jgi:hypothetical protein
MAKVTDGVASAGGGDMWACSLAAEAALDEPPGDKGSRAWLWLWFSRTLVHMGPDVAL